MGSVRDSAGMLQSKRRILMSQPHLKTISNEFISQLSLSNAEKTKIRNGRVYFDPVWTGNGTATINNKHQILQRTAINYRINSKLPSGYQRVEYIMNNIRYNVIDTGIDGADDSLEFQFKVKAEAYDYGPFFGNSENETTEAWRLIQSTSSADASRVKMYFCRNRRAGSSATLVFPQTYADEIIEMYVSFNRCWVKIGNQESNIYITRGIPGDNLTTSANIAINATALSTTSINVTSKRNYWYYFKIWKQGVLVRDFIPCVRQSDSTVGFYDMVSQQFFGPYLSNRPFTAGPTVDDYEYNTSGSISLGSDPFYGGYLDLDTGVLTSLYGLQEVSKMTNNPGSITVKSDNTMIRAWLGINGNASGNIPLYSYKASYGDFCSAKMWCNIMDNVSSATGGYENYNSPQGPFVFSGNSTYDTSIWYWLPYQTTGGVSTNTAAAIKSYLVDNDCKFVGLRRTPVTYQLSSAQIELFRGINNLEFDTNQSASVDYWCY